MIYKWVYIIGNLTRTVPSGAHLGEGCRGCTPPWDDLRFSNATGILQKKNYVVYWCWSRARDTPSYKKILDPPLPIHFTLSNTKDDGRPKHPRQPWSKSGSGLSIHVFNSVCLGLVPGQIDSPYLITKSWITIPTDEYYTTDGTLYEAWEVWYEMVHLNNKKRSLLRGR